MKSALILLLNMPKKEEMTPMLSVVWMVLLHLRVSLSLNVIFEMGITRFRDPKDKDYCLLLKVNTWNGRAWQVLLHVSAPVSPPMEAPYIHTWLVENMQFTLIPNMIGWTIGGRMLWKSSARKVTHLSTIQAFRRLNLGVSMRSGFRPWV